MFGFPGLQPCLEAMYREKVWYNLCDSEFQINKFDKFLMEVSNINIAFKKKATSVKKIYSDKV